MQDAGTEGGGVGGGRGRRGRRRGGGDERAGGVYTSINHGTVSPRAPKGFTLLQRNCTNKWPRTGWGSWPRTGREPVSRSLQRTGVTPYLPSRTCSTTFRASSRRNVLQPEERNVSAFCKNGTFCSRRSVLRRLVQQPEERGGTTCSSRRNVQWRLVQQPEEPGGTCRRNVLEERNKQGKFSSRSRRRRTSWWNPCFPHHLPFHRRATSSARGSSTRCCCTSTSLVPFRSRMLTRRRRI